jgi:Rps23 Pro-64 3,4-dihydroxylase Tpa1-like proline 4-hydroxylase
VSDAASVFFTPRLPELALANAEAYQAAEPYPHIAIHDFLDREAAEEARRQFPRPDDISWHIADHTNAVKRYQFDERYMPPAILDLCRAFNSSRFVLFLEHLTGIDSLIPDPHLVGGGMHQVGRGGHLGLHADFNWHHKLQLHRRLNALIYLSPDWDDSWGGALEFWRVGDDEATDSVMPQFNTLAVFTTGSESAHGNPVPVACPEGVYRQALNFYYYTSAPAPGPTNEPHWTRYLEEDERGLPAQFVQAPDPRAVSASAFAVALREDFLAEADQPG